jgi:hypothetical protein
MQITVSAESSFPNRTKETTVAKTEILVVNITHDRQIPFIYEANIICLTSALQKIIYIEYVYNRNINLSLIPSGSGDQFCEWLLPSVHFYHLDAADDLAH